MKLQLCAISGSREGETFVVDDHARVSFGRTTNSDIAFLDDGHMSSLHFEVVNHGHRFEVRDCGSTNGTWINNCRITVTELSHGDLLKAGKSVMRVEVEKAEPPGSKVPAPARPDFTRESDSQVPMPSHAPTHGDRPRPKAAGPIQFSVDGAFDSTPPVRKHVPPPPAAIPFPDSAGSPIESVQIPVKDPSPLLQSGMTPPSAPPVARSNVSDNPFTDSCDFGFHEPPPVSPNPILERPGTVRRGFCCLERKIQASIEDALALILAKVMANYSMRLVVHFQKIRIGVPSRSFAAEPLLDWFGSGPEGTCSPVLMNGEVLHQPEFASVLPRLCRADALLAFFGTEPKSLEAQIKSMVQTGVAGFAEEGGFLASCWPSSLMSMIDISGTQVCEELFANRISGTVFCTPGKKQVLRAYANPNLASLLEKADFSERV